MQKILPKLLKITKRYFLVKNLPMKKQDYIVLATTYFLRQRRISSELKGLTAEFEMESGVPPSLESPRQYNLVYRASRRVV